MCRLFGMTAGWRPLRATFWLLEAPDSLAEQSRRNPDGYGIATYEADGSPRVDQRPAAAYEDESFAREAKERESPTFVAHVRYASTGAVTLENTHPFEQERRVFAHNGYIGDWQRSSRGWASTASSCRAPPSRRDRSRSSPARSRRETATSAKESWRRFGGWPSRCRCTR
jgi:predicted glutamine amidotransferase